MITWRDDDIGHGCEFDKLRRAHDIHRKYNVPHRMAIVCADLDKSPELIEFIKSDPLIDPQYHCFRHIRLPINHGLVEQEFDAGLKMFRNVFGRNPSVWHPAWNHTDEYCNSVAAAHGLQVSYEKFSMSQFMRVPTITGVVNYHFWFDDELNGLDNALKLYSETNGLLSEGS